MEERRKEKGENGESKGGENIYRDTSNSEVMLLTYICCSL